MKKKQQILVIASVFLLLLVGGILFWQLSKPTSIAKPQITQKVKAMPSQTLADYKDPAGFVFQYPHDTDVIAQESTNSAVYSDITITSAEVSGSIRLLISDTKVTTLDKWLVANNISSSSAIISDTTLGTLSAKEIVEKEKTTLVALDNGISFVVTVNSGSTAEKEYWNAVYAPLKKSFTFQVPEAASVDSSAPAAGNSGDSSGDEIVDEGEEIIE